MHVFVAGASGAIGQPLLRELLIVGHKVTAMVRTLEAKKDLEALGVNAEIADAFDESALEAALVHAQPEIVIDQLTSLPKRPNQIHDSLHGDVRLRIEGGGNLFRAAQHTGVRRYVQQSSGFFLRPGVGLADESEPMATGASPDIATSARMYAALEARALSASAIETIVLRYGFFYGPNTWYRRGGAAAETILAEQFPIIGDGGGVWSFVHVEDAARATVSSLHAQPGVYNVVDDDPLPVASWLPRFASWLNAPAPGKSAKKRAGR